MKTVFTKMHGLGNDFMLIRAGQAKPPPQDTIRRLADRRTGVGFDQLLWLDTASEQGADIGYRVFNADGSEAEQCGNGARCVARYFAGPNASAGEVRLQHPGGIAVARLDGTDVSVSMGEPDFAPGRIPLVADTESDWYEIEADGTIYRVGAVSMGNPHAVLLIDDIDSAPVAEVGAALEGHARFPNRANIGFMQIVERGNIRLRVYERGVGETYACGTGACAAVAVGRRAGLLEQGVSVDLPGGTLRVEWSGPGDEAWLAGEAVTVFEGEVDI